MTNSLYDRALQKLAAGKSIDRWLFRLDPDSDRTALEHLHNAVRTLLRRDDLSPRQISALAKLLLGFRRLPLITPGLNIHLSLSTKSEDEGRGWDVYLREDWFCVEWAGWVRGPFGSDSISGDPFEMSPGQEGCGCLWKQDWIASLPSIAEWAEVDLEDESRDAKLDWEHDHGSVFYQALTDMASDERPDTHSGRLPLIWD